MKMIKQERPIAMFHDKIRHEADYGAIEICYPTILTQTDINEFEDYMKLVFKSWRRIYK